MKLPWNSLDQPDQGPLTNLPPLFALTVRQLTKPMRIPIAVLATAAWAHAASIRGVVVENASGHPLARSLVVVQAIAGTPAETQAVRTDHNGQFNVNGLPAGAYLLLASRRGFAPAQYGQKRWKGSGVPLALDAEGTAAIEIRLERYGSLAGSVLDENDVGLPEHEIAAYRNTRPPVLVTRGKTDDRGQYRLFGLDPGSYLVRSVGKDYDEGSYLPTFLATDRAGGGGAACRGGARPRDRFRGRAAFPGAAVHGGGTDRPTRLGDTGIGSGQPGRDRGRTGGLPLPGGGAGAVRAIGAGAVGRALGAGHGGVCGDPRGSGSRRLPAESGCAARARGAARR
jgi:hypothetical protein